MSCVRTFGCRSGQYPWCSLWATRGSGEARECQTAAGNVPLLEGLKELRDSVTRARVLATLDRLWTGLVGDWESIGDGSFESRIEMCPGFRVYYVQEVRTLILLLCGGDKRA